MFGQLIKVASSQGVWAVLAMVLIFYILKAQEKRDDNQENRELNYQKLILDLTDTISMIGDLREDIKVIKNHVCKNKM